MTTYRPERIYNVSQTQLSVARFYGGCKFNGADYHYDAETDTLTRMDIWQARIASNKENAAKRNDLKQLFAESPNPRGLYRQRTKNDHTTRSPYDHTTRSSTQGAGAGEEIRQVPDDESGPI